MRGTRKSTIACTLLVAAVALAMVVSWTRGGFGQQAVIPTPHGARGDDLQAKFYVRLQLMGEAEIIFEQVQSIQIHDHWANLEIIENEQLAVLNLPRENIQYIKSWPLESEEQKK